MFKLTGWKRTAAIMATIACGAVVVAARQPGPPDSIVFEEGIPYREVGGETLRLDFARPKQGDGPFPVVLFIHGGGWRAGNKRDFRTGVFGVAQQGAAAFSVQYRFAPKDTFPAQLEDVKAAVRYIREHAAERKVDPDRIAVIGGSAGAHLALMLATTGDEDPKDARTSSAVKAAVSLAGPTDLTRHFPDASRYMLEDFLGKDRKADLAAQQAASPLFHLNAGDAPMLLIHGTKDPLVPYDQATLFRDACGKAGVDAELFTVEGGDHGGGGDHPEQWQAALVKSMGFLHKHLGLPAVSGP